MPPRAALAATVDGEIVVVPVSVTLEQPADPTSSPRIVQVPEGNADLNGRNVVVIADDGPQWFRLRSLSVRGQARAIGDRSYRVAPKRIVAWDYGSLREVPTPQGTSAPRPAPFSVTDEKDDTHPFHSPNLEAAVCRSRVMVLASRSHKGTPFAVPLWFVPHHGRIYATTSASSWIVAHRSPKLLGLPPLSRAALERSDIPHGMCNPPGDREAVVSTTRRSAESPP
ncbi:pyridoxamine 5'-phosphate oxidase family protein [Mycobacterium numidiamassiliense]